MTDALCCDTSGEWSSDAASLNDVIGDLSGDVSLNQAWLTCLLDIVAAAGIRRAVVSPGGCSTAMVLAVRERVSFTDVIVMTDERTGAFTALGMIKASGEPAMVVTTSGSAVAGPHQYSFRRPLRLDRVQRDFPHRAARSQAAGLFSNRRLRAPRTTWRRWSIGWRCARG